VLLNAAVAEALGEMIEQIKATTKRNKPVEDAVLAVVREAFMPAPAPQRP
jgi:protein-L-isoaspartate O-methyltransferase